MNIEPTNDPTAEQASWPEALATVTQCKYDFGAGRALAFGIPLNKHFRISYNYFANDELHTGQFSSDKAIPQGHLFPIRYNPNAPREHEHEHDTASQPEGSRAAILTIGIIGSIVLSLAWLIFLRACH
ncbi:MAG: hypothetical protein HIU91_09265 [Acidobacteria bacterium]|nr:hypothetical protein [Acidobacteriota bacterium]